MFAPNPFGKAMDLDARTLKTLDWPLVLERLAFHARTARGARAALELAPSADPRRDYAAVLELRRVEEEGDRVPVAGVGDVAPFLVEAARGRVLDAEQLVDVGRTCAALEDLRIFLQLRDLPVLGAAAARIRVDSELTSRLVGSFDERGQLSEDMYPELGELRRRIQTLEARIRSRLEELLKELGGALQDRFVTQRGDRWVLPLKAEHKRAGLGIVHDSSHSGETVFVEPAEVVELTNELKLTEGALRREERRIFAALSALVGRFAGPLEHSLGVAEAIDLTCARVGLGQELRGQVPRVGDEGVVHLPGARHPVLALRGVAVVPNDLDLAPQCPGLVLSGPNTGGKTVALKTIGLAALFARCAIPFPAAEGCRIDLFSTVIADIGDLQSVSGDLSTFSGHLLVLREVLRAARPGVLVLLDEVGEGTDPAQGAALARSVLERVVEAGARVAVTTHSTELKAFARSDARFTSGAMLLQDGRPTYKMELGAVGLSHAFSTARRLGLDEEVVSRAESLLSEDARRLATLLQDVEAQRTGLLEARRRAESDARAAEREKQALEEAHKELRRRMAERVDRETEQTRQRLREAEARVKGLIAALQADPELARAGRTLEQIRATLPEPAPAAPPPRPIPLAPGMKVRAFNRSGVVLSEPRKGMVELDLGGIKTRVKVEEVRAEGAPPPPVALAKKPAETPVESLSGGLRTERNTLDLRGFRAEEALDETDRFLARLHAEGEPVGWVLHGHGSGALKQAIRAWLPRSGWRRWRPADTDEGGDAFTRVEV